MFHDTGHLRKSPCERRSIGDSTEMCVQNHVCLIRDENMAVRLENDVLITENGVVDLMADIPIEADDIERLMAR